MVKNVAGYDLGKLVCGSEGKLALIARVSLRLHPLPARPATLVVETDDTGERVRTLRRSQLQPSALDVLHPGRVAVLFEGSRARRRGAARRGASLVGGVEADATVWHEARERQGARSAGCASRRATSRNTLSTLREAVVRPAAGVAYVPRRVGGVPDAAARRVHRALKSASTRRGCSRDRGADEGVRALRVLPADLPDVRPLERGDGLAAWPHPADGEEARRHAALSPTVVEHFDRCLGCMACLSSCPSGVQYDRLIEETRRVVETEHRRPRGERLQRRLLFATLPYPRRMRWALRLAPLGRALPSPRWARPMLDARPALALARAPARADAGRGDAPHARVGLLAGCVQTVLFGDVNAATARVLAAEGFEVVVPRQGCCGALSAHAGRAEESAASRAACARAFEGVDTIVVNASGCGSHLKDHGLPALDVTEALARCGAPDAPSPRADRRLPGLLPPPPRAASPCRVAAVARADPRPRGRGARRAGPLLRLGRDLQRHAAGSRAGARRSQGRERAGDLAGRLREREPGLPRPGLAGARAGRGSLPALHPVELLDASIRGVAAEDVLARARS